MGDAFKRYGCMLVVSGPSGTGKSTLCQQVLAADPGLRFSTSCTTRRPRPGEVDGRDYHFVGRDEFERRVAAGDFIEHAEVHGNFYGTLAGEVMRHLEEGVDVLLDIDVQGAQQIRAAAPGKPWERAVAFVFIGPPTYAELERRLRGRGTEEEATIQRRLAMAVSELGLWREYDYCILNDELAAAVREFQAVLAAERLRTTRQTGASPWPDLPAPREASHA